MDEKERLQSDAKAVREKYWDELDDKGKIERMRDIVKDMKRDLEVIKTSVQYLNEHQHIADKIVVLHEKVRCLGRR